MTQQSIEMVIGRLVTDEEFRRAFHSDPHEAIASLLKTGMHLTRAEIAALVAMDPGVWARVSDLVDPRLQKADLTLDGEGKV
ncbi:MAG: Os1348 family NHLP clan protein [Vicinamibacterales bacterium]